MSVRGRDPGPDRGPPSVRRVTPLWHQIAAAILQLHIFDFLLRLELLGFRCRQSTLFFLGRLAGTELVFHGTRFTR